MKHIKQFENFIIDSDKIKAENREKSIDSLLEDLEKKDKEKNERFYNKIFRGKGDNV